MMNQPAFVHMIKLQMVLQVSGTAESGQASLTPLLAALGIRLTARGLVTASAEISSHAYQQLWGDPTPAVAGFANSLDGQQLQVPPTLATLVQSISTVPRHTAFNSRSSP